MSFRRYCRTVSEGDTVIICRGLSQVQAVRVSRGGVIQVQGGAIKTDDLLGKQYGSKVYTSNGKQWVLIVHPTSEWWTIALPHRTQILYSTDISIITLQLQLRPGSIVCECGTGSGSLSHAIIRTIAPNGHLYTCDFHEQRVMIAREEFSSHELSDLVTVECRDVCTDGFAVDNVADAVFLDIPQPWNAIGASKSALKATGGRLCCFSPCIEQVQQTCIILDQQGFCDIEVMECIHRPINVRRSVIKTANLGLRHKLPDDATPTPSVSTVPGGDDSVVMATVTEETSCEAVTKTTSESVTTETSEAVTTEANNEVTVHTVTANKDVTSCHGNITRSSTMDNPELSHAGSVTMTTAQPATNITGHTGYLTFATLGPADNNS